VDCRDMGGLCALGCSEVPDTYTRQRVTRSLQCLFFGKQFAPRRQPGVVVNDVCHNQPSVTGMSGRGGISANPGRSGSGCRVTDKGLTLTLVLFEIAAWGASHDPDTGAPDGFPETFYADRRGFHSNHPQLITDLFETQETAKQAAGER